MAVQDGDAVAGGGDAEPLLVNKGGAVVGDGAEDLAGLGLELVLLAADEGDDVVNHVHARHARVAGARDGLHGDDADLGDGAKGGLQRRKGDDEPDDGAVGVAHEEALGEAVVRALVRNEVEVRQVDRGDDEGHEGILAVVFGVGEDGDFGLEEFHFWFLHTNSQNFVAVNNTCCMWTNGWGSSPISPATSESNPLKTTSQSPKLDALHSRTTSSLMSLPMGAACFHRTASLYFLPAERDEAPTACSFSDGCCARRRMNRWPTEPVAPRTPRRGPTCQLRRLFSIETHCLQMETGRNSFN